MTQSTPTRHPCFGRSAAMFNAFEAIAIGQDPRCHPKTIKTLLAAGLIEQTGERVIGTMLGHPVKEPVYEVPLPVHAQWCAWCAENVPDEELS